MLGKKIRVSTKNSKVLAELVNHGNSITYPGLGKLVEYNGPYVRVNG